MVKAKVTAPEVASIPEGVYEATFSGIEEIETKYGRSWRWSFTVVYDGEPVKVTGITSAKLSTKSKAYKWASAILGRDLQVGEEIDMNHLKGLECLVEVENRQGRLGEISNVINVMRKTVRGRKKK